MSKRLGELVRGVPCAVEGNSSVDIRGISYHSAAVEPGYLFVAVDGFRTSGSGFVDEAVNRGAVAVATSEYRRIAKPWVAQVVTQSPRRFLAQVANRFYDFPARKLCLVGITGTNGKTTTSYLLRAMCRRNGIEPGFIGTVEYWDGERTWKAGQTTPESLDLVRMLDRMVSKGVRVCIAEVSSHALELDRVFDIDFKVGVFTNLTQDHLDFHRTLKGYRDAKLRLFTGLAPAGFAVLNLDDPVGREFSELTRACVVGFGTRPELRPSPSVVGRVVSSCLDRLEVEVVERGTQHDERGTRNDERGTTNEERRTKVSLALAGSHNLMNLLAAWSVARVLGWPVESARAGAEALVSVPGRMERFAAEGFDVLVDYAHTPDALRRVLSSVREFSRGRVVVVFGCGGERDRSKRPLMGAVVAELADLAIVTSDNPRGEAPEAIIGDVLKGFQRNAERRTTNAESREQGAGSGEQVESTLLGSRDPIRAGLPAPPARAVRPGGWQAGSGEPPFVEPDRRAAIERALGLARPGDIVVVAGKGHEEFQAVGNGRVAFDDRRVVREFLAKDERRTMNDERGAGQG